MNWQIATLAALGVVLVAGFAWYERSRPDSRMIALVAALAALAVAGRLVLTPVPNVVATTDVALLTGFALGAAPGFAVGALAAPITNMWLGQGPWTIWQMAGWGLAGLLGALLAKVTAGRCNRLGLAFACAAMGLVYGALLDLSVMVSYGGEQSLDRYLALSARGIPFNVAHAIGNFVIAFAAGPALVRMIARYRERLAFNWHPAGAMPAAIVATALTLGLGSLGSPPSAEAAAGAGQALSWVAKQQNSDGGFGPSPGYSSNAPMTGWTMLGMEAAGRNPLDLSRAGNSPVDFLRANSDRIRSVGDLERTILALEGAGVDARSFAGRNLVSELASKRSGDGSFDQQVNLTAFGAMALRAGGGGGLGRSAKWLQKAQGSDGGWGFNSSAQSDADSTGAAIQGLAAAGSRGATMQRAVKYLKSSQIGDGGWAIASGPTNSQSTAWAVQGLIAAGVNPAAVSSSGHDAFDYLRTRQRSDGHYAYSSASDQTPIWVTAQALLATKRKAFPLAAVARAPRQPKSGGANQGGENGSSSSSPGAGGGSRTGSNDASDGTPSTSSPGSNLGSPGNDGHGPPDARQKKHRDPTSSSAAGDDGAPASATPGDSTVAENLASPGGGNSGTSAHSPGDSGDSSATLLGGLGVLALIVLGGGWYWYRQRVT